MLYYKIMHKNFEHKERKKHISNLIRFFFIFSIFTFWSSHTIPIIFYSNKHFFVKKTSSFFGHFQHGIFFLSTPFYSNMSFFSTFHLTLNKVFFEENEYDIHFFNFSFFQNKTSFYFGKEPE